MITRNDIDKAVPVVRYECPVCGYSCDTEHRCFDHIRSHVGDEIIRTIYLNREEDGEFTFDIGEARPAAPGCDARYSTPGKSTSWRERWYVDAQDDPDSIAKAKKELVQAALEWYRAGLSQLEALKTNHEQEEE